MSQAAVVEGFEGLVEVAVADLAARLEVEPTQVRVVSAESVTWPDGGLGCPRPGMVYPQVLVDGARIVLEVDGRLYAYHSGGTRGPFLCAEGQPAPSGRQAT